MARAMVHPQQPERRRARRPSRRFLVHDRTGSSRTARPAIDLWQDGMRLLVQREHLAGALIELDLYLGDRPEPLRVQGELASARGGEALIRFRGLSPADRVRLTLALGS